MIRVSDIKMGLDYTPQELLHATCRLLHISPKMVCSWKMVRRSVDARKKETLCFRITVDISLNIEELPIVNRCRNSKITLHTEKVYCFTHKDVVFPHRPVVVGAGPAGLFAALMLAKAGARPILIERGRDVDSRIKDVNIFLQTGVLDTHSNVQFGEGGAGTFSDGKLNTGIKDVRCRFVLEEFVRCGAPEEILWQGKPHIGTDNLKTIVKNLRKGIQSLGGEVRFETCLDNVLVKDNRLSGIVVSTKSGREELPVSHLILAVGHSARDTVKMLYHAGICMEQKSFAIGLRIEHPRIMIDHAQYGTAAGHSALGAADYKLVQHLPNGRSAYSFCMCPGGEVIAAASENGGVVVNGMSVHARNAVNSNSALLVGVNPTDFHSAHPLSGFSLQRHIEELAFSLGGGNYRAPAQLVGDFLQNHPSSDCGDIPPSYKPGVTYSNLHNCLPAFVSDTLCRALPIFGQQICGFDRSDAILTGVESRSSSPVRILRNETGQCSIAGLYPCGEGAGYAGGITSAATDGIRCAEWAIADVINN